LDEFVELAKSDEVLDQTGLYTIDEDDILVIEADTYDYSDDTEYYNSIKYLTIDEFNELKSAYKTDMQGLTNTQFLNRFSYICSSGFDYEYYTTDESVCSITIYTISPDATDEMREKISKMSPTAILKMYASWSDDEFSTSIEETYVTIYLSDEKAVSLLKSFGVDIK
jgi:hypothetical protein